MNEGYTVGFGKPPKEHQFTKGQSGNAKGRKKGSRNLKEMVDSVLCARITITENGRRTSINLTEGMLKVQAKLALGGDRGSAKLLLDLKQTLDALEASYATSSPVGAEERRANDAIILAAYADRVKDIEPEVAA
jgi:hypothetical protein